MRKAVELLLLFLCCGSAFCQGAPEAAPGLIIPGGIRPWALDEFQGKQQLSPMHSSAVQTNNHKGSNAAGGLLGGPFYKAKFTTELEGARAATVLHSTVPVFYLRMDPDPDAGQTALAGWAVVHVVVDKDRRLLSTVKFTQFTGSSRRSDTQVEATTEALENGWIRVTPKAPLTPGEYALEPVMKQENAFSLSVYDFRVDPAATENSPDAVTKHSPN